MKSTFSIIPSRWITFFCILAGVYAVTVLTYILIETGKPLGSRDFHQFWYAGHFILQGQDPYEAFFAKEPPNLPIHYLDGVTVDRYPVAQPELEITPSNTPTMLLLLAPFAYFSWGDAKWAFMFINLVLMLITGWLVIRRLPFAGIRLAPREELFLLLVYFDFSATRIAIENGQTTLFVFLLMILALLYADRSWVKSGLALGVALSKYSLSLPIFLFLLYKRKFKILLVSIAIQLLGILGMTAITGNSPVTIVTENIQLFFRLFDQPSVHLSRWFEFISEDHFISLIPALVMTAMVFIPILFWTRSRPVNSTAGKQEVIDFHIVTILFIWVILVAYHRLYDTLILLTFIVLIFKGLAAPAIWNLTQRARTALLAFLAMLPLILILPARIVDTFIPEYYGRISDAVTSVTIIIMLIISMFLLWRSLQTMQSETLHQRTESHDLSDDPHRDTQPRWLDHPQSPTSVKRS
jgi:hypothetical protein